MKFRLVFDLDNDAFQRDGELDVWEVVRTIEKVTDGVVVGKTNGIVKDANGNAVGGWEIKGTPEVQYLQRVSGEGGC